MTCMMQLHSLYDSSFLSRDLCRLLNTNSARLRSLAGYLMQVTVILLLLLANELVLDDIVQLVCD
jgi:hypothetical protein